MYSYTIECMYAERCIHGFVNEKQVPEVKPLRKTGRQYCWRYPTPCLRTWCDGGAAGESEAAAGDGG